MTAWRVVAEGLEVRVRAQPRVRRPGIVGVVPGVDGPRLRIAVSAPPVDGRANAQVISALADALGVSLSCVTLTAGAGARETTLRVRGEATVLAAAMEQAA